MHYLYIVRLFLICCPHQKNPPCKETATKPLSCAFTDFRWSCGRKMNFMNNSIMVYPSRDLPFYHWEARNSLQLMKLRLENYIALSLDCYVYFEAVNNTIIMTMTRVPTSLPGNAIASWSSCVHVAIYLPIHQNACGDNILQVQYFSGFAFHPKICTSWVFLQYGTVAQCKVLCI